MYKNLYSYGCSHSVGTTIRETLTPFGSYLSDLLEVKNFVNRQKIVQVMNLIEKL